MAKIVVVGNGIAGVTAARHIRKLSDHEITIVSSETKYFFSRTALMYVYMGHMKFEHTEPYEPYFWKKNRIDLIEDLVEKVDTSNKSLSLKSGSKLAYDKLIIATGSKPNKFGWPGQDLDGVLGMYHKQDLDNLEKWAPDNKACNRAVVVGGGLIGIELVEMLASRKIPVTFLVREASFWSGVLPAEESKLITEHIKSHHVDLRLSTNLEEIISDENGRAKAIKIQETGEEIACNIVGLTAGVSPNIAFLKDSGIEIGRGVKVNRFLETNVPDVYAIGDCAEQHEPIGERRAIEAVWYTGRMMGETVAQTICDNKMEYQPGNWFNSAKFMDIEYQTYGWVWAQQRDNEARFYWQHPTKELAIHVNFDKDSNEFIGINTFGIRMRHELFDEWLTKKASVQEVMANLRTANFDPEFYRSFESEILSQFNSHTGLNVVLSKKQWWRNILTLNNK